MRNSWNLSPTKQDSSRSKKLLRVLLDMGSEKSAKVSKEHTHGPALGSPQTESTSDVSPFPFTFGSLEIFSFIVSRHRTQYQNLVDRSVVISESVFMYLLFSQSVY